MVFVIEAGELIKSVFTDVTKHVEAFGLVESEQWCHINLMPHELSQPNRIGY